MSPIAVARKLDLNVCAEPVEIDTSLNLGFSASRDGHESRKRGHEYIEGF